MQVARPHHRCDCSLALFVGRDGIDLQQIVTGGLAQDRYDPRVSNVLPPQSIPPASLKARNQPARWLAFASLVVALVAIGAAVGAWLRPLPTSEPPSAPTYSNQQTSSATVKVCAAHAKVQRAAGITSARSSEDPTAQLAIATSGRQALDVGSDYLISKLIEEPATPSDLAASVRKLAAAFSELAIDYLAESPDSELDPLLEITDQETRAIENFCK